MRMLGVPAALVAIVAVPALVAQHGTRQPRPPVDAQLTVRLAGDDGGPGHPAHVAVRASGPPPRASTVLVDGTGTRTARVAADPAAGACRGSPLRTTGSGGGLWCLRVSDVAAGAVLEGTAIGTDTRLRLTVTRRDAFAPWPLLALLAGIGTSIAVALAPRRLRRFVRRAALARLLDANRNAPAADRIQGLDAWVDAELAGGADPSALYSTIAPVIRLGPAAARQARRSLRAALATSPLGAGHPFALAARAEAERTDQQLADFLDERGRVRARHPAATWLDGLRKLTANDDELRAAAETIATAIPPRCRATAAQALDAAQSAFARIGSPDAVTDLDAPLDALTNAIDETLAAGTARHERWTAAGRVRGVPEAEGFELAGRRLELQTGLAALLTLVACAAVLLFTGVTVEQAVYRDNHTFDGFHDYFMLFSTALASGAAAGVLALLAYWRPDAPARTP